MKNKFTVLEMKAKKLHRRAGSSSSAIPSSAIAGAIFNAQLRSTSSHPNLLTLRDDVELMQRAKSFVHLSQATSLPSSPVSHGHHNASPLAGPCTPPAVSMHAPLSPEPHHHLSTASSSVNAGSHHSITPTASPSHSPTKPIPINLAPNSNQHIPINPTSTSPISTSPLAQDYTLTTGTTISSDETYSEGLSQHDTASLAEEYNDEWDVEWLLEEGGDEKQDDSLLFAEVEGRIDLQGGLSHFVQFLSAAKQDWAGRFMDRVLREDVAPCLRLRSCEDRAYRKLLEAVWNNKIFVEPLGRTVQEMCAGCGAESTCRWRVKLGSSQECKNMGDLCRERIIRTCDFYSFLRNLKQGLVKKTLPNIFKEYLRLRLMMNFARICAG